MTAIGPPDGRDAEIAMIEIASIEVLNPRSRNRRIFDELVDSIRVVGLKRPITIRRTPNGPGYELVCGQGRMEAFAKLGQTHIPAMIIEATREECYVMSLVENMARRNLSPLELVREVGALRQRGYSNGQIAEKVGMSEEYVYSINLLLEKGRNACSTPWSAASSRIRSQPRSPGRTTDPFSRRCWKRTRRVRCRAIRWSRSVA